MCGVALTLPIRAAAADTSAVQNDYTEVTEDQITYYVYADHAAVGKADRKISGKVTVSDKVGGMPVTEIGEHAFSSCYDLIEVVLPDTVTEIGIGAFSTCNHLESVKATPHKARLTALY